MAEVLLSSERRVAVTGYGLPPPETLLGRLDQIDMRLRLLEEQRRPTGAQAEDDGHSGGGDVRGKPARHQHTKSMPSALQHVQLKGNLMDRLNLLESRIRQLSCELDGAAVGYGAVIAGSSLPTPRPAEDRAWSEPPLPEPCEDPAHFLQKRQLHRSKPNPPKNLKETKRACHNEKGKAERSSKPARKWFTVGC